MQSRTDTWPTLQHWRIQKCQRRHLQRNSKVRSCSTFLQWHLESSIFGDGETLTLLGKTSSKRAAPQSWSLISIWKIIFPMREEVCHTSHLLFPPQTHRQVNEDVAEWNSLQRNLQTASFIVTERSLIPASVKLVGNWIHSPSWMLSNNDFYCQLQRQLWDQGDHRSRHLLLRSSDYQWWQQCMRRVSSPLTSDAHYSALVRVWGRTSKAFSSDYSSNLSSSFRYSL